MTDNPKIFFKGLSSLRRSDYFRDGFTKPVSMPRRFAIRLLIEMRDDVGWDWRGTVEMMRRDQIGASFEERANRLY